MINNSKEADNVIGSKCNPEEKLQSLRKIIFTNGLSNTRNYIEKYFEMFDSSEKGFNNYADEILSTVRNLNNVSHLWESKLNSDEIINEMCKNAATGPSLHIQITDEVRQQAKCLTTHSITIVPKNNLSTNANKENKSAQNNHSNFKFKSLTGPISAHSPGSLSYGITEDSNSQINRIEERHEQQPYTSCRTPQVHTKPQSDSRINEKYSQFISVPVSKNDVFSVVSPKTNQTGWSRENCGFRTAKNQLDIDARKKHQNNTNSPQIAGLYGSNKKSLGTRKGVWSDFVAPIPGGNRAIDQIGCDRDLSPQINTTPSMKKSEGSGKYDAIIAHESLRQFEPAMIESLLNEIMDSGRVVKWDDIAGLELPKKILQEIVMLPMMRPDIFTGIRAPAKGLLLFGPPGTGKTLIGKCIASQSKSTFFSISASSLTSKWVGQGEKMVRIMFTVARLFQPAVIFIDEIDSLLSQRNETEHESSRKIKTEFLVQMDGVGTGETEKLLLMGATNRPQEIDEAARRRFVKRVYIPLPSKEARRQIIENTLRHESSQISSDQLDRIVNQSEGFSGADMTNLCKEAAMGPIRNVPHDQLADISLNDVPPIQFEHFRDALNNVKSSVSPDDIDQYIRWNDIYGSSIKQH